MDVPTNFLSQTQVKQFVENSLSDNPQRVSHVLEIAKRVKESGSKLGLKVFDLHLAECAALLHDIGYWKPIAFTGFHPIDGARFLESKGEETLANIIVGHSCSPEEGELMGFPGIQPNDTLIGKLITYWDVQVKQGGEVVKYEDRVADIISRYGKDSIVGKANILAKPRIEKILFEIDSMLAIR